MKEHLNVTGDNEIALNGDLKKWIAGKWKTTESVVESYIQVILYEPASEEGEALQYMHSNMPSTIMHYCKAFVREGECDVVDGPVEMMCPGYDGDPSCSHLY